MAFSFDALPAKAKRAAFAKMNAASRAKSAGTAKPKRSARKAMKSPASIQRVERVGDKFQVTGTISREEAAVIMFGTAGAHARLAKAKKKPR